MKSTIPSTPAGLEITPFTVTTEWVNVTIRLSSHNADFLAAQNDTVRNGIGGEVSTFSYRARRDFVAESSLAGYKQMIEIAGRMAKGETGPFSFTLPLRQWQEVEKTAGILSTTAEQISRAAIARRISEIREYDRESNRKGGVA